MPPIAPSPTKPEPRLLRRIAQQRLHEEREQDCAAEQRKSQHEHQKVGRRKRALSIQVQIDNRIPLPPLPKNHENERNGRDQRQDHDEVGLKPILSLTFVEYDLKRAEAQRDSSQSDIVNSGLTEFPPS